MSWESLLSEASLLAGDVSWYLICFNFEFMKNEYLPIHMPQLDSTQRVYSESIFKRPESKQILQANWKDNRSLTVNCITHGIPVKWGNVWIMCTIPFTNNKHFSNANNFITYDWVDCIQKRCNAVGGIIYKRKEFLQSPPSIWPSFKC